MAFSLIPSVEVSELTEDVRDIFEELAATLQPEQRALTGECHPALDVFETDEALEIVMDAAGIARDAIRVVFRAGVVLVAGEKAPQVAREPQTFHLVEREFGRFARAVRVSGAFDVQAGRASIVDGELTIVLPKRADRRGRAHRIEIGSQR
ncbi:MAG TPA: Hsp20/alpha crystallin family protein [Vicinamibacterales bacterium]|jgi:HSP20 family protein|nr:Hsp20/alpha crystallin family protein [Vicinamibacterales bacterium]